MDSTLDAVRAGSSAALVLRDETTTEWPADFRIVRTSGAESDMDLRYAGLHQLCAQLLDQVERLSPPQRDVLRSAFDPSAADPDPSSAGLTVFSLLAGAAESRPLVCLVRRPEWLDEQSRRALAVTARRLVSESVALVFVVEGADVPLELAGLSGPRAGDREADPLTVG